MKKVISLKTYLQKLRSLKGKTVYFHDAQSLRENLTVSVADSSVPFDNLEVMNAAPVKIERWPGESNGISGVIGNVDDSEAGTLRMQSSGGEILVMLHPDTVFTVSTLEDLVSQIPPLRDPPAESSARFRRVKS